MAQNPRTVTVCSTLLDEIQNNFVLHLNRVLFLKFKPTQISFKASLTAFGPILTVIHLRMMKRRLQFCVKLKFAVFIYFDCLNTSTNKTYLSKYN